MSASADVMKMKMRRRRRKTSLPQDPGHFYGAETLATVSCAGGWSERKIGPG
jgi:hypothetical protein